MVFLGIDLGGICDVDVLVLKWDVKVLMVWYVWKNLVDGGIECYCLVIFLMFDFGECWVEFMVGYEICVGDRWEWVEFGMCDLVKIDDVVLFVLFVED